MRSDRNAALKLRLSGRSYNEISRLLEIPKSTLASWFTGLELSRTAQDRINERVKQTSIAALVKRNHSQTYAAEKLARSIRNSAKSEITALTERELLIVGVSLYWAEGYKRPKIKDGKIKTSHPVTLSNSDPKLAITYLKFLREVCKVPEEKITAEIRIYDHQNEAYLVKFWSKIANIPTKRLVTFKNGVSISSKRIRPFNVLPYGTIQVRVNSTQLYHRIMGWIEGLSEI